ncbi:MAG: endonuclease/exonuclease/phosphatase family protein [Clostridiales bacterium]|nr:endonuclease/exonuclease/phosphatase family protein [Clostridiales bacterium]
MVTISIRLSAREKCAPLTVNRLLKAVRKDRKVKDLFWPRLVKDKSINYGKKVGAKVDLECVEFLRELKKEIKSKYGIFVPYSMLVCVLLQVYKDSKEKVCMSLNVKGYKSSNAELAQRLKDIAKEVANVLPDILFLQEFKAGENDVCLNALLQTLGNYYEPVFPVAYKHNEDYNNCMCIMLKGKHVANIKSMHLKDDHQGFRLRYNLVDTDDYVILNAWIPQIFNNQNDRINIAETMWKDIMDISQYYSGRAKKFFLVGDLNSFIGGPFEDRLMKLNALLRDTKTIEVMTRPTGIQNILDYSFVNRFADQTDLIRTSIYSPSIKNMDLSDHDALVTTITESGISGLQ